MALDGLSVKEMSGDLNCQYRTIQTHWLRLCQKIQCRNRDEAMATFVRWALGRLPADALPALLAKSEKPAKPDKPAKPSKSDK